MNNQNDENKIQIFEDEKEILLDHNYDGIQELDHPLPFWWVMIFAMTISFGIPYYMYYNHFDGPTLTDEYQEELDKVTAIQKEADAKKGGFDIDSYKAIMVSEEGKQSGEKVYRRKCSACHGQVGEGGIGPNLTDKYWIHGDGSVPEVYKVVDAGVLDKGMPAWGTTITKEEVMAVVGHIAKFVGTNPENAKEPQGELKE